VVLPVVVTVAASVTDAPAVTGFGETVRTVLVDNKPGLVLVLGELEPPQPRRRKPAKAKADGATRIDDP
jgi:hypothetical protein